MAGQSSKTNAPRKLATYAPRVSAAKSPAARAFAPLLFSIALSALGQTAPAPATAAKPGDTTKNDLVQLDPFEVKTDKDTSYGATNSNSIALFNVELDKVPVVADVMTQQ